jgi:hypothetical protein
VSAGRHEERVGRGGFWQAVRVEVDAFGRGRGLRPPRRLALAWKNALATLFYKRRAHPSGQAVCLLGPRRALVGLVGVSVLAVGTSLGALAPVPALAVLSAAAAALLPRLVLRSARSLPSKWRWRRLAPRGRRVYLRSLASTQKGAGAELLAAVVEEADLRGWTLVLDAADEALVRYYERFGFVSAGCLGRSGRGARMWRASHGPAGPLRAADALGAPRRRS